MVDARTGQKIRKAKTISLLAQGSSQTIDTSSQSNTICPREQMQFMSENIAITDTEIEYLFNNQDHTSPSGERAPRVVAAGPPGGHVEGRGGGTFQIDDFMKIKKLRAAYHTSYVVQNPFRLDLSWGEAADV